MGGGTGRLPGREVKRDLAMHVYICYCPVPFIWKEFCRDVFLLVQAKRDPSSLKQVPAKAGQFLSYKHSVPLCRDDIMLTLQIVPGEIVSGRNILI